MRDGTEKGAARVEIWQEEWETFGTKKRSEMRGLWTGVGCEEWWEDEGSQALDDLRETGWVGAKKLEFGRRFGGSKVWAVGEGVAISF